MNDSWLEFTAMSRDKVIQLCCWQTHLSVTRTILFHWSSTKTETLLNETTGHLTRGWVLGTDSVVPYLNFKLGYKMYW